MMIAAAVPRQRAPDAKLLTVDGRGRLHHLPRRQAMDGERDGPTIAAAEPVDRRDGARADAEPANELPTAISSRICSATASRYTVGFPTGPTRYSLRVLAAI